MEARIDEHRRQTAKEMFQQLLFPQGATEIEVDPEIVFTFDEYRYAYNWPYIGRIRLPKHFFKHIGELESEGEEFSCAQYISLLPEVKFWVRNMSKRDCSFWLPTSTDKFYPDFIAKLIDDRILVVECKGEHLWSNDDSKEKRDIGALWASRSNGQCIFVMPNGEDWKAIEEAIRKKPAGSY